MADDTHIIDLVPAYVLGSLERDEALQVAEHVAHCTVCRAEVASYQATVDRLAFAVPEVTAPPDLRVRVLSQIRSKAARVVAPLTWWEKLASFLRRSAPAWGLASLVLVLVLGASTLALWQRLSADRQATRVGDMPVIALVGAETAPEARGVLVMSANGRYGTLVVDDLAQLDDAHQYQLWLIREDGVRLSGGVFDVDSHGYGALEIWSREPLSGFAGFGVTVEPAGGSPGPTGARVLGTDF